MSEGGSAPHGDLDLAQRRLTGGEVQRSRDGHRFARLRR